MPLLGSGKVDYVAVSKLVAERVKQDSAVQDLPAA
jgi:hypothetical protein